MKAITCSFILSTITNFQVSSFLIPSNQANSVLNSRQKRANGFLEEVRRPSDIDRECGKESCVFEEYIEAKENEFIGTKVDLRGMIDLNGSRFNHMIKSYFDMYYTQCVKNANKQGVVHQQVSDKYYKVVVRQTCIKLTDERLNTDVFKFAAENGVKPDKDDSVETTDAVRGAPWRADSDLEKLVNPPPFSG